MVFYDEFEFTSAKLKIPFNTLIGYSIVIGIILFLYFIIKSYIFGDINKYSSMDEIKNLKSLKENVLGMNV